MDQIWTAYLLCTRITLETTALRAKLTKPIDRMGWVWTAHLLCTRITLETTALRAKSKPCSNYSTPLSTYSKPVAHLFQTC